MAGGVFSPEKFDTIVGERGVGKMFYNDVDGDAIGTIDNAGYFDHQDVRSAMRRLGRKSGTTIRCPIHIVASDDHRLNVLTLNDDPAHANYNQVTYGSGNFDIT